MTTREKNAPVSAIQKHEAANQIQNMPEQGQQHTKTSQRFYRPPLDVLDFGDRYEIHVDLPGASRDHIDVTIDDSVLTLEARVPSRYGDGITPIRAEYGVGDYRRQIRLGEDVNADALTAAYADGVLKLSVPRLTERQPRRIEIAAG